MSSPPLAGDSQSPTARSPRSPVVPLSSSPRTLPILGSRIIRRDAPHESPLPTAGNEMESTAAAAAAPMEDNDDDDDTTQTADMPLTLAASVILTNLPGDAKEALKNATTSSAGGTLSSDIPAKVTIRVHALGSSPQLKQQLFMLSSNSAFSTVLRLLRKKLQLKPHEGLHCYIGQSFSPALDVEVAGLWKCFKTPGLKTSYELVVQYALSPTFG